MTVPSITEALSRLEANPAIGAQFDQANPGLSRRAAVEACLKALEAKSRETAALKTKIAAAREKLAALTRAKASLPPAATKASPAAKASREVKAWKAAPKAAPAAPAKLTGLALTAESFRKSAKPKPAPPNRPSARALTGLEKTIIAFKNSAK